MSRRDHGRNYGITCPIQDKSFMSPLSDALAEGGLLVTDCGEFLFVEGDREDAVEVARDIYAADMPGWWELETLLVDLDVVAAEEFMPRIG